MSKYKVLIHFGFPKTGSSSLQFGLFKALHEKGVVNLNTWRMYDKNEHLDRRPSSRLFNYQDMLPVSLRFKRNLLNILSDESFTAPLRLRRNNYGKDINDPFNFPRLIKRQIEKEYGDDVMFYPIIFIRNQPDLLYSQYVEEYNLKRYKNIDLIFDNKGNINLSGFEIYKFNKYFKILEYTFGKGVVKLFLFERWKHDYSEFNLYLSKILEYEGCDIEDLLSSSKFNTKEKLEKGYLTKDKEKLIPYLTERQEREINSFFREDNLLLQSLISKADLERYKYI